MYKNLRRQFCERELDRSPVSRLQVLNDLETLTKVKQRDQCRLKSLNTKKTYCRLKEMGNRDEPVTITSDSKSRGPVF